MVVEEYKKEVEKYLKGLSEYLVNFSDKEPQLSIRSIEEWDVFLSYIDECSYVITNLIFREESVFNFRNFLRKYLGYEVTWNEYHKGFVRGFLVGVDFKILIEENSIEKGYSYFSISDKIDFVQEKEEVIEPKTIKYEMSIEETKSYRAFEQKHRDCKGLISYIITPGPIGDGLIIKCTGCGEEKDICDYNW